MIIELCVREWAKPVFKKKCKNTSTAIAVLAEASKNAQGRRATVIIEDEAIGLDFAESPDFEGEVLKLHSRVLKKKQRAAALKTAEKLKKDPDYYKKIGAMGAHSRWKKQK